MAKNDENEINYSRRAGRQLAEGFTRGQEPVAVSVRMALQSGESCVGHTEVQLFQWQEGDGEYVKKSGGYAGLPSMAIVGTANIIGNALRRAAAGRAAAAQWRPIDGGVMYMTTSRIAINGERRWTEFWFSDIRMSDYEPGVIILEIVGAPRIMMRLTKADYWFVMLQKVAYGTVFTPPEPTDGEMAYSTTETYHVPPPSHPPTLVGRWIGAGRALVLAETGEFMLNHADGSQTSGTWGATERNLALVPPGGSPSNFGWQVDGNQLSLTRKDNSVALYIRDERSGSGPVDE